MNEKVRIITDSGCDISRELEKEWEKYLVVMTFMVNINGKDYVDRVDIQEDESYQILKEYEAKYPWKFKAVQLFENRRQGGARNAGMEAE